tara:strand:- start:1849 stop:2175 length:327 start_codon:yes stop_codon:yes gene_type:complete
MNEEKRLNEDGKRMVAWNGHISDDVGAIWCMVVEDEAGYRPMTGRDELAAPWYLARLDDHRDEDGKVDYAALWRAAQRTVDEWNEEHGYLRSEATEIVTSSMRAQGWD